jgi:hypothetical protein
MGALNRTVVAPLSSAIIAVLLAGIVVVGVDGARGTLREGEARLQPTGVVEVAVDGAPFVRASRERVLARDDQVRVVEGKAVLQLPRSSTVELRSGSLVTVASGGRDPSLVLEQGDLLVEAPHDTVRVEGGMAVASVAGSARLRRGASLLAGVYGGNVNLQKNERSLGVPQYRQAAAVGTGLLPQAPDPLDLQVSDEWDRRLLGEVLSLSQQLEIFGRSFEAQLPAAGPKGIELFKTAIPELADAPITPAMLAGRAPGENLIGLSLVALDRGDFDSRVRRIFGFRAAGASWGLVAADRDLNPNPLLATLESAINRVMPAQGVPGAAGASNAAGTSAGLGRGRGGTTGNSQASAEELLAGALVPAPSRAQPANGASPASPTPGGRLGTNPTTPPPSTTSPTTAPPAATPPPKKKTVDLPPTGTLLDPLLEPVVTPLENLLSGVLDNHTGSPGTPPGASLPVTSPATPPTTSAPATPTSTAPTSRTPTSTTPTTPPTTAVTAPAGGLLGGLVGTLGGLIQVVGGLLH